MQSSYAKGTSKKVDRFICPSLRGRENRWFHHHHDPTLPSSDSFFLHSFLLWLREYLFFKNGVDLSVWISGNSKLEREECTLREIRSQTVILFTWKSFVKFAAWCSFHHLETWKTSFPSPGLSFSCKKRRQEDKWSTRFHVTHSSSL